MKSPHSGQHAAARLVTESIKRYKSPSVTRSMIVLYNTNTYLGGGETLLIRFAEYLASIGADFIIVCARGSFIEKKIKDDVPRVVLDCDANYYYLSARDKQNLLEQLGKALGPKEQVKLVTFCMRDLHSAYALAQLRSGLSIVHLVLHIQDDLYTGQTIGDKLKYKFTGAREFNHVENIAFNRSFLKRLNDKNAVICMAEVIADYWNKEFQIEIPRERIVPLPSFVEKTRSSLVPENKRSVIWIGRLVDFKIPSIIAMIRFLSTNPGYTLTIVGSGDATRINNAMQQHGVDPDRVKYVGELGYEAIGDEITKHSIGYAMGTSLVELAMYRIPVIVALASYDHKEYEQPICGGLFFDQPLGCDGSELILGDAASNIASLQDSFNAIAAGYDEIAVKCYEYAKENYSADTNFRRYVEIVSAAGGVGSEELDVAYPKCQPLRRLAFNALAPK